MQAPAVLYQDEWYSLKAKHQLASVDQLTSNYFRGYVPDEYEIVHTGTQLVARRLAPAPVNQGIVAAIPVPSR